MRSARPGTVPDVAAVTGDGARSRCAAPMSRSSREAARPAAARRRRRYDYARRILNASFDKHPALIVQPSGVADIQAAVNFARAHNLLVAVKCGGHSHSGQSTCDRGMQIDLSTFRGVRVDPRRAARRSRAARCSARWTTRRGARSRDPAGHRVAHRRRRPHARRRLRPPRAPLRHGDRQSRVRRHRHRRRPATCTRARRKTPICFGPCAAAAATSASSRTSSSGCTRCSAKSSPAHLFPIAKARDVLDLWSEYAPTAPDELYIDPVMVLPPGSAPGSRAGGLLLPDRRRTPSARSRRCASSASRCATRSRRWTMCSVQRVNDSTDSRASARISRAASSRRCRTIWSRRWSMAFKAIRAARPWCSSSTAAAPSAASRKRDCVRASLRNREHDDRGWLALNRR